MNYLIFVSYGMCGTKTFINERAFQINQRIFLLPVMNTVHKFWGTEDIKKIKLRRTNLLFLCTGPSQMERSREKLRRLHSHTEILIEFITHRTVSTLNRQRLVFSHILWHSKGNQNRVPEFIQYHFQVFSRSNNILTWDYSALTGRSASLQSPWPPG